MTSATPRSTAVDSQRGVFSRFEIKYLAAQDTARAFAKCLDGYMYADPHSDGPRGYRVCSTYWDSADLALFWEKVEGVKFRRKLRFRWYREESDEVYVEIKQRINRTIQKRRSRWPADRLRAIFLGDEAVEDGADDPVVSESLFLLSAYALQPTMGISYRRLAYFGRAEQNLRVTFDTDVRYCGERLDMGRGPSGGKYVIEPDLAIVEIKFNDRVPRWLCRLVSRFELTTVRLSKYCRAVDLERFEGRLT